MTNTFTNIIKPPKTDFVNEVLRTKKLKKCGASQLKFAKMPLATTASLFKGVKLYQNRVKFKSIVIPLDAEFEARVEINNTINSRGGRSTLTRTVAGGLVAGPLGAVVGAGNKQKLKIRTTTNARVIIQSGAGYIDQSVKNERTARNFVKKLNNQAIKYRSNKEQIESELQNFQAEHGKVVDDYYNSLLQNATLEQKAELKSYKKFWWLRIIIPVVILFIVGGIGSMIPAQKDVPDVVGKGCKEAISELNKAYFAAECNEPSSNKYTITAQSLTGKQETHTDKDRWTVVKLEDNKIELDTKEKEDADKKAEDEKLFSSLKDLDVIEAQQKLKDAGFDVKILNDVTDLEFSVEGIKAAEMKTVVKSYSISGNTVTLRFISAEQANEEVKKKTLEAKLGLSAATAACQTYGERNYKQFKMHSIAGHLSDTMVNDDTWELSYMVDYNGYKNNIMVCDVTGTSENPRVINFSIHE